jgi:hypothetical protein
MLSFRFWARPRCKGISVPFLSIKFADDLLNPLELLHLPARHNYHELMVTDPASLFGHETLSHPAVWASGLRTFLDNVPVLRER